MNYVFKAFFHLESDAESAYYILRHKNLVTDLEISSFFSSIQGSSLNSIAYGLEGNTLLSSLGTFESISSANVLATQDPRVIMAPILFNEKQTSSQDACFLYGHCQKKDITSVIACLKRSGAFCILSSNLSKKNRLTS